MGSKRGMVGAVGVSAAMAVAMSGCGSVGGSSSKADNNTFTIGFVVEEQAVFPRPGERSPAYDIEQRNQALDAAKFPLMRKAGPVLFDQFDKRYRESMKLITEGARASASR